MMSHKITVTVKAFYAHSGKREVQTVSIDGDGDIDHFLTAYQAGLVAAGFATGLAERLMLKENE